VGYWEQSQLSQDADFMYRAVISDAQILSAVQALPADPAPT